jgi:hypothetical protein
MVPGNERAWWGALRRVGVATVVLALAFVLVRYGDGTLAWAAGVDVGATVPRGATAVAASVLVPTLFAALTLHGDGERGLGATLAGLALVGAGLGAAWLAGVRTTVGSVSGPVLAAYGVGLTAVVAGYVLNGVSGERRGSRADRSPSYVRDEPDPITTLDGGEEQGEIRSPLEEEE